MNDYQEQMGRYFEAVEVSPTSRRRLCDKMRLTTRQMVQKEHRSLRREHRCLERSFVGQRNAVERLRDSMEIS